MTKAKQLILPISYPDSGRWYAPVRKIKIDERTYALRMGEPVQLGTVKEIEKEFRVGRRVLARLADIGVIARVRPRRQRRGLFCAIMRPCFHGPLSCPATPFP